MKRVALYLSRSTARSDIMIQCARHAAAAGERVVTAASEPSSARRGYRPVLRRLMARMEAGEFDAIVASPCDRLEADRLIQLALRDGAVRIARLAGAPMSVKRPRGSTVAIYTRYSTPILSPTTSDGQIRLYDQCAANKGWIISGRTTDDEQGGATAVGRKGLLKRLLAAERGECQDALPGAIALRRRHK